MISKKELAPKAELSKEERIIQGVLEIIINLDEDAQGIRLDQPFFAAHDVSGGDGGMTSIAGVEYKELWAVNWGDKRFLLSVGAPNRNMHSDSASLLAIPVPSDLKLNQESVLEVLKTKLIGFSGASYMYTPYLAHFTAGTKIEVPSAYLYSEQLTYAVVAGQQEAQKSGGQFLFTNPLFSRYEHKPPVSIQNIEEVELLSTILASALLSVIELRDPYNKPQRDWKERLNELAPELMENRSKLRLNQP
jgi:hypothetical protein